MSTVNKKIADEIIRGMFPEDGAFKIVVYQNAFDGCDSYGVLFKGDDPDKYHESEFVRNPRVYWEK